MVRWVRMAMVALGLGAMGMMPATASAGDDLPLLGKAGDFTLAPPDVSEEAPGGWYLRADAGYVDPIGGALHAGPARLSGAPGAGWSAGAGVGYRVLPFLRVELGIEYLDLGSAASVFGDVRGSATVGLASVNWDLVTVAGFTPYLSAGAGLAYASLDGPAWLGSGGDGWGFAWSVGGGVSYAVSEALSIDLGYRYLDLGTHAASPFAPFAARDLAAHQIRLGVRYALN